MCVKVYKRPKTVLTFLILTWTVEISLLFPRWCTLVALFVPALIFFRMIGTPVELLNNWAFFPCRGKVRLPSWIMGILETSVFGVSAMLRTKRQKTWASAAIFFLSNVFFMSSNFVWVWYCFVWVSCKSSNKLQNAPVLCFGEFYEKIEPGSWKLGLKCVPWNNKTQGSSTDIKLLQLQHSNELDFILGLPHLNQKMYQYSWKISADFVPFIRTGKPTSKSMAEYMQPVHKFEETGKNKALVTVCHMFNPIFHWIILLDTFRKEVKILRSLMLMQKKLCFRIKLRKIQPTIKLKSRNVTNSKFFCFCFLFFASKLSAYCTFFQKQSSVSVNL